MECVRSYSLYFSCLLYETQQTGYIKKLPNPELRLKARVLSYLVLLLEWYFTQAEATGISYIDATSIAVCHPKRIARNKTFAGLAALGKTTKGWFFGLKLHLLINENGEIQNLKLTKGNVDDRTPVPAMTKNITGLLFGDKGYIKQELFNELHQRGLKLVTGIKKGMKNKLTPIFEKILLRKRSIMSLSDFLCVRQGKVH